MDCVAILQAKPLDTTADRAASPPDGGLSHTLAATPGLVALAAVVGTMLVAIADKIALVIWAAQLQAVDRGAWLPLP
jgi:hypothetical protein